MSENLNSFDRNNPSQKPDLSSTKPLIKPQFKAHIEPTSQDKAAMSKVGEPETLKQLLEPYKIHKLIRSGGMGSVYLAEHANIDRKVALKIIRPENLPSEDMIIRFNQEVNAIARIDSPHVVKVYDAKWHSNFAFLALEFIDGKSASDLIDESRGGTKSSLSENEVLQILHSVCKGLHCIHSLNIIHRDLKPSNIMIPYNQKGDLDFKNAKIVDFGLSKDLNSSDEATSTGAILGTPGYIAPEQIRDSKSAGISADIYGVGATAYTLLSGRDPFSKFGRIQKLDAALKGEYPSLKNLRPDITSQLETLVEKALSVNPEARYRSSNEIIRDLELIMPALRGKDLVAFPDHQKSDQIDVRPLASIRAIHWNGVIAFLLLGILLTGITVWYYQLKSESSDSDVALQAQVESAPLPREPVSQSPGNYKQLPEYNVSKIKLSEVVSSYNLGNWSYAYSLANSIKEAAFPKNSPEFELLNWIKSQGVKGDWPGAKSFCMALELLQTGKDQDAIAQMHLAKRENSDCIMTYVRSSPGILMIPEGSESFDPVTYRELKDGQLTSALEEQELTHKNASIHYLSGAIQIVDSKFSLVDKEYFFEIESWGDSATATLQSEGGKRLGIETDGQAICFRGADGKYFESLDLEENGGVGGSWLDLAFCVYDVDDLVFPIAWRKSAIERRVMQAPGIVVITVIARPGIFIKKAIARFIYSGKKFKALYSEYLDEKSDVAIERFNWEFKNFLGPRVGHARSGVSKCTFISGDGNRQLKVRVFNSLESRFSISCYNELREWKMNGTKARSIGDYFLND